MNRWTLISIAFLFSFCTKKERFPIPEAPVIHSQSAVSKNADTLWISPKSKVFWKGTKMRKLGKHEGEVLFESGYLLVSDTTPIAGYLVANMQTIRVTDIPETDPVPLKELTEHLKNPDFFEVNVFPKAYFDLVHFAPKKGNIWTLSGNLIIKGISNPVSIVATRNGTTWTCDFEIDRFAWNIAFEGSWADRTLVDRKIQLRVVLELEKKQ